MRFAIAFVPALDQHPAHECDLCEAPVFRELPDYPGLVADAIDALLGARSAS